MLQKEAADLMQHAKESREMLERTQKNRTILLTLFIQTARSFCMKIDAPTLCKSTHLK